MRVLLDACVWGKAKAQLAASGHEVVWVGDWKEDPGDERYSLVPTLSIGFW